MSDRVANCPNCGAPVRFRYAQAVQTTCEYCHSILVRHDVDLEKVGTVAELPPNGSPIQLGTEGIFDSKPFVVVGRIIYEYDSGNWNEWHIIFNDGQSGWLSDAQLDYAVSFLSPQTPPLPPVTQLARGGRFEWSGTQYEISVITQANYRGVEGDLPFTYWDKSRIVFVDLLTHDGRFATIDYSEELPLLFLGRTVTYDELKLKNVREFEGWQ